MRRCADFGHLIDRDSYADELDQPHPAKGRVDVGDQFAAGSFGAGFIASSILLGYRDRDRSPHQAPRASHVVHDDLQEFRRGRRQGAAPARDHVSSPAVQ